MLPIERWLNAVSLQHVGHSGIGDVVAEVLECSLNSIEAPRGILLGEAYDGTDDFLSDPWLAWLSFIAGIELLRDEISMPSQDRVWCNDGCQLAQSLQADGMRLHSEQSTLVMVKQESLFSELLHQGFDLCVLELNDLLLTLVHEAAETGQHDVAWLED